jgi:hypothetical protein
MNWRQASLFFAGFFFGGALDHAILGLMNSPLTPYGARWGVAANWLLAAFDVALAAVLYRFSRSPKAGSSRSFR